MSFVYGSLIAVAGWVISHWLTLRAQRKNFQDQLLDRARMEIAHALHRYQDWLGLIYTTLMWANSNAAIEAKGAAIGWDLVKKQAQDLLHRHREGSEWSLSLEEYESLFPETAAVRVALLARENEILKILSKLSTDLTTATFPGAALKSRLDLAEWAVKQESYVFDQQSLIADRRVHLQNASLHRITGAKVRLRQPTDLSLPMIVPGPDGRLQIAPASAVTKESEVITKS